MLRTLPRDSSLATRLLTGLCPYVTENDRLVIASREDGYLLYQWQPFHGPELHGVSRDGSRGCYVEGRAMSNNGQERNIALRKVILQSQKVAGALRGNSLNLLRRFGMMRAQGTRYQR